MAQAGDVERGALRMIGDANSIPSAVTGDRAASRSVRE